LRRGEERFWDAICCDFGVGLDFGRLMSKLRLARLGDNDDNNNDDDDDGGAKLTCWVNGLRNRLSTVGLENPPSTSLRSLDCIVDESVHARFEGDKILDESGSAIGSDGLATTLVATNADSI
jgi:hypothetical protein